MGLRSAARIQAEVQEAHDAEERELEAMRMEGEQEELAANSIARRATRA